MYVLGNKSYISILPVGHHTYLQKKTYLQNFTFQRNLLVDMLSLKKSQL